jgi:hypothetical protein
MPAAANCHINMLAVSEPHKHMSTNSVYAKNAKAENKSRTQHELLPLF